MSSKKLSNDRSPITEDSFHFQLLCSLFFNTFLFQISIVGVATERSIILVDSFRYLPPGESAMDCSLYETDDDDSENITTNGTTTMIQLITTPMVLSTIPPMVQPIVQMLSLLKLKQKTSAEKIFQQAQAPFVTIAKMV